LVAVFGSTTFVLARNPTDIMTDYYVAFGFGLVSFSDINLLFGL
jgi:hypothetical protein